MDASVLVLLQFCYVHAQLHIDATFMIKHVESTYPLLSKTWVHRRHFV